MDGFKAGKILFLFLQSFAVIFMLYDYDSGFIALNVFSMLYFLSHLIYIQKNIAQYTAEITKHHKDRVKGYRRLLAVYIVFVIRLILRIAISPERISVLWWIGSVYIMTYGQAVTISAAIAFAKNGYVSGDYFVAYKDIEEVREEKTMRSLEGEILLVSFWKNNKKIGFDKLFVDEYQQIRLEIYQN
jgi:hypothetical protein